MEEGVLKCAHHTRDGWGGLYQWDTPTGEAAYFEFEEGLTAFLEGLLARGDVYSEARRAYRVVESARNLMVAENHMSIEDAYVAVVHDIRHHQGVWLVTFHNTSTGRYAREVIMK